MMSLIRVLIRKQILLVEWVELFRTLGEAGRHCSTSSWSLVCAGAGQHVGQGLHCRIKEIHQREMDDLGADAWR